jgi:hypothetical protein
MAPKKCGRQANSSSAAKSSKAAKSVKKRPRGLLGLASGYNSESDDDYQPTEPAKKHKPGPAKVRTSKHLQRSENRCCCCWLHMTTTNGRDCVDQRQRQVTQDHKPSSQLI